MGLYFGRYRVTSDLPGDDPSDNEQTFQFVVSNQRFAKEIHGNPLIAYDPYPGYSNVLASYYYFVDVNYPNDGPLKIEWVEAGIAKANELTPDVLGNQASFIIQFIEWVDLNNSGIPEAPELNILGFNQYDFQNGETANTIFLLPLLNVTNLEQGVSVEAGVHYILTLQFYNPPSFPKPTIGLYSVQHDYNITYDLNLPQTGGKTLSGCSPQVGKFKISDPLLSTFIPSRTDTVPVLRIVMPKAIATQVVDQANVQQIQLYPNPVNDVIQWVSSGSNPVDEVQILDINGRINMTIPGIRGGANVSDLLPGIYIIRASMDNGHTEVHRFVKE